MEFVRAKRVHLGLDMAPLIDIVFQLLIFFMLSSSFFHPALRLDLPKAAAQEPREPERVVVSVDREGQVFINSKKTSMEDLKPSLEQALERDLKKVIHIQGDQEMPYRIFVKLMDEARQAGARQIYLVHEAERR